MHPTYFGGSGHSLLRGPGNILTRAQFLHGYHGAYNVVLRFVGEYTVLEGYPVTSIVL